MTCASTDLAGRSVLPPESSRRAESKYRFLHKETMMKNTSLDLHALLTSCLQEVTSSQQHPPSFLSGSSGGWNVATGTAGVTLFYHQMGQFFPGREWHLLTEKYLALTMLMLEAEAHNAALPL